MVAGLKLILVIPFTCMLVKLVRWLNKNWDDGSILFLTGGCKHKQDIAYIKTGLIK